MIAQWTDSRLGFQICATVRKLDAVKKLTKPSGGMGLILSAAYTGTELDVGIEWPAPGTVCLPSRCSLSSSIPPSELIHVWDHDSDFFQSQYQVWPNLTEARHFGQPEHLPEGSFVDRSAETREAIGA